MALLLLCLLLATAITTATVTHTLHPALLHTPETNHFPYSFPRKRCSAVIVDTASFAHFDSTTLLNCTL
jgi:hypothetical protein